MNIVITNIHPSVFLDEHVKKELIELLGNVMPINACRIAWLKSFNRIIVTMPPELSYEDFMSMKIILNTLKFMDHKIKAYEVIIWIVGKICS